MRNLLKKLTCLLVTLIMCVSFLGGCNLITTDSERDLNQVIATIDVSGAHEEHILKKDVVMAYINYGYYYQQQGSEMGEIVNSIVSQLINNRVYVQNAIYKFDSKTGIYKVVYDEINKEDLAKTPTGTKWSLDMWDLTRYLTDEELTDAEYNVCKDIDELIDAYNEDKPANKVQDTLIEEIRTVPTGAENKEEKLEKGDKDAKIAEFKANDFNKLERKKAYNDVIKVLKSNELLGSEYNGKIATSDYYKQSLKNYQENAIIEKFEKCVKDDARAGVTCDDVKNAYLEKYNAQKAMSEEEFATMLDSASADEPVLVYNGKGSYGYVYNLLLGPGDDVLAKITEIDTENKNISQEQRATKRAKILDEETIVKDLRSTWIMSGYDFEIVGEDENAKGFFKGDYAVAGENSLAFQGVAKPNGTDDDGKTTYGVESVTEYSLKGFIALMEEYLYGVELGQGVNPDDVDYDNDARASVYRKYSSSSENNNVTNYVEKVNELLFAFSTDPGSLNTYKGYSSAPEVDPVAGKQEKYMQEFADAARELLKMGNNSYIIVATDYGYHVMFYSEVIDNNYNYADLEKYLNAFCTKTAGTWAEEFTAMLAKFEDYDTDSYLYKLYNSIASSIADKALSDEQGKILDYVFGDNSKVVKYEDRYADLLGE